LVLAPALLGQNLAGSLTYVKNGVEMAGRIIAWKDIASIEERSDPAAEYAARKQEDTPAVQFELGRWCREHGLDDEAGKHFRRALELDPALEAALCAMGRAPELVAQKRQSLKPMEFADWCRDRALFEEQWNTLVVALAKDAFDREAIPRMKAIQERHCAETLLHPPFTGRWKALVDTTRHHQQKCYAFFAIDFAMVDATGKLHRGNGKAVTDYFGYGQPVLAAADGVVDGVENGFEDSPIGKPGGFDQANYVEIQHRDHEVTDYGHLKKGSVVVKVGQRVKRGELIGLVGNSGASGLPHVHFTMDMSAWVGSAGVVLGRPWRLCGCRLVEANGTACSIDLRAARPQEGWVLECPAPDK
jgi:hypothetical protein